MDWPPEFNSGKPSPKRELQLQGPRPTPLQVRKDSHKIKKPPIAPQHHHQQQDHQQRQQKQQQQQRQPVIIYTVSPKVIHTNASEFMSLVQRLTGSSTDTSTSLSTTLASPSNGAISPAARFATIENTKTPSEAQKTRYYHNHTDMDMMLVDELFNDAAGPSVERTGSFPGILSPVPSSLPIVPPDFFSPPSDHNPFNFNHDLSPLFQGNKNYFDGLGSFGASPGSTFLSAPPITSPTLTFDLFNQFLDF